MKFISQYLTTLFFLLSTLTVISTTQAAGTSEQLALDTVNSYLNALSTGDINQIKSHLAPDLLKERESLLDNPTYSAALQNTYSNATFEVLGSQTDSSGKVWVDVKISLNQDESIHSRFVLDESNAEYLIISER